MGKLRTFYFGKIVRDKIPNQIIEGGGRFTEAELSEGEKLKLLANKLKEESQEIDVNGDDPADEIADAQAVLNALRNRLGLTEEEIQTKMKAKEERYGGFNDGVYIEEVHVRPDDPWVKHFTDNPDRYPER